MHTVCDCKNVQEKSYTDICFISANNHQKYCSCNLLNMLLNEKNTCKKWFVCNTHVKNFQKEKTIKKHYMCRSYLSMNCAKGGNHFCLFHRKRSWVCTDIGPSVISSNSKLPPTQWPQLKKISGKTLHTVYGWNKSIKWKHSVHKVQALSLWRQLKQTVLVKV